MVINVVIRTVTGQENGEQLRVLAWLFASIMLGWFIPIKYSDTLLNILLYSFCICYSKSTSIKFE